MKLKPLVLLLAASVLASGCSQTVKSTLDAPTDVTYQVADEDASGIPIVEPDAALNPATMPTVAQLILIEYGKTSVTQFEALLGSPSKIIKVSSNQGFVIFDSNRVVGGRTEDNPGVLVVHEQLAPKQLPSKEGRFRYSRGFSPRGLPPICCHFGHEILFDATLVRQGMESPAVGTS